MAFLVQWLRGGEVIHDQPMLGENIEDIIKASRQHTPQVIETTGKQPEEIRILDSLRKEGIALPVDQEGTNADRT